MNLILWRHAEAEDIAPDRTDAGRRLTERGEKQARNMAAWLDRHLPREARILASPAIRTRQTAEALNRIFSVEPRLFTDKSVADHLAAAGIEDSSDTVVLVGHQPTLGQLAAQLLCGAPQPWSVRKGAVWWLELDRLGPPARLLCVLDAKRL